jgi:two-component system, NarL family, response regulator NreC
MAGPTRILLIDDHAAVRRAVKGLLESVPEFSVCGEAENGRVGIEKARQLKPELIVLDLSMPVMNGLEATRILHRLMPGVPILMYTSFADANLAKEAVAAGVSKVASKTSPPEALLEDLRTLLGQAA